MARNCIKNAIEIWNCLIPQYIYGTIRFVIANSQNDFEQLATLYGVYCLVDGGPLVCNKREENMIITFREKKSLWRFWLRTCLEHYGTTMKVFNAELEITMSLKDAFEKAGDPEWKGSLLICWIGNIVCMMSFINAKIEKNNILNKL